VREIHEVSRVARERPTCFETGQLLLSGVKLLVHLEKTIIESLLRHDQAAVVYGRVAGSQQIQVRV
jgi:hypothetical protein